MKKIVLLLLAFGLSFPCLSFGQFNLVSSATDLGGGEYRLTQDFIGSQGGAIWSVVPLDIRYDFILEAKVFYGDGLGSNGGADGMAFALQAQGPSALGFVGGGLGIFNVFPSYAVRLRTWTFDEIDFMAQPGVSPTVFSASVPLPTADNLYHDLKVVYNAQATTSEVYFDNVLISTYVYDFRDLVFDGQNTVTWGFTAATGGAFAEHRVKDIRLTSVTIPTMSQWGLIVFGLVLSSLVAGGLYRRKKLAIS